MIRLAILHFQPLELYPPATNLIEYISSKEGKVQTRIYSMYSPSEQEEYKNDKIRLYRKGKLKGANSKIGRLWQYCSYYFYTLYQLLKYKPTVVMYFETLSFLPVYIYCSLNYMLGRKIRIFCHYHEYTSPQEYDGGMIMNRRLHTLEKKWYTKMEWISHTNIDRMRLFKTDVLLQNPVNTFILPNYPPATWFSTFRSEEISYPVRFVYVGALGMNTMYIQEFMDWIEAHKGRFNWDIFSQQDGKEVLNFLKSKNIKYTKFKGHTSYKKLPNVLKDYDVGVILYKGHIPNYIYNIPNKLFEYLACGLDVWYPQEMTTCHMLINTQTRPKVISIDFKALNNFDEDQALNRKNIPLSPSPFFCENELDILWNCLSKEN